jgi:oligoribonuclease
MESESRLIWLDLEMSGLDPERERILEIATVVTDARLEVLAEGPNLVIRQPDSLLEGMDDWNREHHGKSGLIDAIRTSTVTEEEAERRTLEFLGRHGEAGTLPLAGNSISHDRRFLARYMPRLEEFFHYRNVDVSTVKELVRRWYPILYERAPEKKETHRAVEDIHESIEELRYYRRTVFLDPASAENGQAT